METRQVFDLPPMTVRVIEHQLIARVNGTPKLTPWRHLKSDPLGGLVDLCWIFWFWCPGRRGGSGMVVSVLAGGGRNAPQIAVFKPVAVPFKRENLRVMD